MKPASRKPQPKRKYFKSRGFSRLFCFSWEQRKLMSLCEKFTDGDWIEAKDQSDFGVRLIQTGNVGLGEYIDKPTNKKWIAEETFERLNCEEVFAGDILISRLPEPAGRACIMPNIGVKMITAVDCTIVRTATHINPKYLLQYLSSQSYFDKVNTCLAGGTRQRISRSNLAAFDVPVPAKYEEQKAIGEFLCGIDNLITLHQRDSIMRFFGAWDNANAWEQRKLGELVDVCSGRDYKHLSEGTIPVYGTGGYMLSVNDALSYDRDAIGIGRKGTIDKPYILKAPFWTVDTLFYAIPREKVDLNFAFDIFQNIDWKKKDESTGVPSLSKTAINDIDVLVPKHGEQQTIGQFFAGIDHLITLHQRERKNRLFGGKNVKQYNFSRLVLQLLRAMDSRLQRRGSSQGDYG